VTLLRKKAVIGDIPILLGVPQPAFVVTETEVTVVVFSKEELKEGLDVRPATLKGKEKIRRGKDRRVEYDHHPSINSLLLPPVFQKGAMDKLTLVEDRIRLLLDGLFIEDEEVAPLQGIHARIAECGTVGKEDNE